jgi:glycerol-3-phosphate dehydrogenase
MRLKDAYDVVVIGGGVIGTSIAARLSQTTVSVCLLERASDLCEGTSKGNAGVTVASFAAPDSLEGQLVKESFRRWEDISERLDVPFARVGALVIALEKPGLDPTAGEAHSRADALELEQIAAETRRFGSDARVLSGSEARALEPHLSPLVSAAALLPDEGIIDSIGLVFAYARLAALNGTDVIRDCRVTGFDRDDGRLARVHTTRGTTSARFVVNAAGLQVGEVSRLASGDRLQPTPRHGQYWVLDPEWESSPSRILIPLRGPAPQTRGVQIVPTTRGGTLIGPTSEDTTDPADTSTHPARAEFLISEARKLLRDQLRPAPVIKSFAANRVVVGEQSLLLRPDTTIENLIHASNRAIGVSCSPALADHTLQLLRDAGLRAEERNGATDQLPSAPRLRRQIARTSETASDGEPAATVFGSAVCACSQVGEAEILEALEGPTGALSLDGVRKRTGAMAGRCQGTLCLRDIAQICSRRLGCTLGELLMTPEPLPTPSTSRVG